jgi:hypothetical protein
MPFYNPLPHPFTFRSINTFAPASPGLYGISNSREWIYIGETENVLGALLDHLGESGTLLKERSPSGFVFEVEVSGSRMARQDRLVMEYEPVCNRRSARK